MVNKQQQRSAFFDIKEREDHFLYHDGEKKENKRIEKAASVGQTPKNKRRSRHYNGNRYLMVMGPVYHCNIRTNLILLLP